MTVVAVDDTDSRTQGMCTTYVGHCIAERLRDRGATVERLLLVRLNPAVPYKTRGNGAVAIHTDIDPATGLSIAEAVISETAHDEDEQTNPGLMVGPSPEVPSSIAEYSIRAVKEIVELERARTLASKHNYLTATWGSGRGLIGALAALGAWTALEEWTIERITYREPTRRGSDRVVDEASVYNAAESAYPTVWDTVDREAKEVVCVPHTPGPVLFGIRGDEQAPVDEVVDAIESEPIEATACFVTNQGTDAHLQEATVSRTRDQRSYRVPGTIRSAPETNQGGHVFLSIEDDSTELRCVAFEPTKRFREKVRCLREGDEITACGEVQSGTLKLEKFAVRNLVQTERVTPTCPDCGRTMKSAGQNQGYRCRDCRTSAPGKVPLELDRELELGWYEVPPRARRHIAKPLIRGGFDGPIHPER